MLPLVRTTWLAIALAACGGSKDGGADWSARPLETVTGKVGVLAYTIQLPHGLAPEAHETEGITIGYEASPRDVTAPSVMIGYEALPPKSVEDAVADTMPGPDDEIVRKDKLDDLYIVTTRAHSHKHWKVNVFRLSGQRGVDCMAQQASNRGELGESSRALLEKICLSLVVR